MLFRRTDLSMAETHPLATAIGTASTKGVLSDLIAQLAVERNARPNLRRVLAFAVFGGLYLGAACLPSPPPLAARDTSAALIPAPVQASGVTTSTQ